MLWRLPRDALFTSGDFDRIEFVMYPYGVAVATKTQNLSTPISFYKNTFYKNIQAEIPEKIRT